MTDFDFVEAQHSAWSTIAREMNADPVFRVINGGTVNGPGSSLQYTRTLREELPVLLKRYRVMTMLDAPCGDLTWLKQTELSLTSYIGMDVDDSIIADNIIQYRDQPYVFVKANLLTRKRLPQVDLILCRHFLQHLTTEYIGVVIDKFKASGSKYLLATNYPGSSNEFDYDPGAYPWLGYMEREHDLTQAPFDLVQVDAISEMAAPGGVIGREHELALFEL